MNHIIPYIHQKNPVRLLLYATIIFIILIAVALIIISRSYQTDHRYSQIIKQKQPVAATNNKKTKQSKIPSSKSSLKKHKSSKKIHRPMPIRIYSKSFHHNHKKYRVISRSRYRIIASSSARASASQNGASAQANAKIYITPN